MEPIRLISASDRKPSAIKYCLFSACAASCTAVFAVIGISLVTQKRFKDFSHNTLIAGLSFLSLALVSGILAVVFKRMYKYHYNRQIITAHRFMRHQNMDVWVNNTWMYIPATEAFNFKRCLDPTGIWRNLICLHWDESGSRLELGKVFHCCVLFLDTFVLYGKLYIYDVRHVPKSKNRQQNYSLCNGYVFAVDSVSPPCILADLSVLKKLRRRCDSSSNN